MYVAALAVLVVALMTISPIFYSSYGDGLTSSPSPGNGLGSDSGSVVGNPLFAKFSTNIQTRAAPSCFTVADLNHDGLPDIAVGYSTNKSLDIYFQTSTGNFTLRSPVVTLPSPATAISSIDMDGDGLPDLVVGYDRYVAILEQKDSFSLLPELIQSVTYKVHGLVAADFDGNGRADLAILDTRDTAPEAARLDIFYQDNLGFRNPVYNQPISGMQRPRSITMGDLNNDGHPDIVIADAGSDEVATYVNNYSSSSNPWTAVSHLSIDDPVGIDIGKFDSSNSPMLAVASRADNDVELWKLVNSTNSFSFVKPTTLVSGINGFADYDLNDDAYSDIAISSNTTSTISIFGSPANVGTTYPITPQAIFPAGAGVIKMMGEDINRDGKEDLVVGSTGSGSNWLDLHLLPGRDQPFQCQRQRFHRQPEPDRPCHGGFQRRRQGRGGLP